MQSALQHCIFSYENVRRYIYQVIRYVKRGTRVRDTKFALARVHFLLSPNQEQKHLHFNNGYQVVITFVVAVQFQILFDQHVANEKIFLTLVLDYYFKLEIHSRENSDWCLMRIEKNCETTKMKVHVFLGWFSFCEVVRLRIWLDTYYQEEQDFVER
jgi:hypothetical protein